MLLTEIMTDNLVRLFHDAAAENLSRYSYSNLCDMLGVAKMYYDMDLGGNDRYRNMKTGKLVMEDRMTDGFFTLYDTGEKTDIKKKYTFCYEGFEFVHAYIEFKEGITEDELDEELLKYLSDIVFIIASHVNMRAMLQFAEITDAQTGVPNLLFIDKKYHMLTAQIPPEDYSVLRINLQNFKYINEISGSRGGDDAITMYGRTIIKFIEDTEGMCRVGGDNFAMFVHNRNLDDMIGKLNSVVLKDLEHAPNQRFEMSAWIGVSAPHPGENRPFGARFNEASIACELGKSKLKQKVVTFNPEMAQIINRGRDIIANFAPAIRNQEFVPFFQPKVDMRTGKLVGFESLARWFHDGRFIFPDQFIPVLDKEGLISDMDLEIFRQTCKCIREWKDMGLLPPRVSSNFSKKNLFVPDIEDKILSILSEFGLDSSDVEIEITESVKEAEHDRLIEFVRNLKYHGLYLSVDDFGTGYSSLSLIHNIDADILKIDRSFVDLLPSDRKSEVLIDSIISLANRLNMELIAEGVETADQGRALMKKGCYVAQGYYYSKPVDYETATEFIKNSPFEAIE